MSVFAVGMVRDENDVIEAVLRHLVAEGVDRIILFDNLSRDGTSDTLARLETELPLTVLLDEEVGFYQGEKTSRLARLAYEAGAAWVLPFDADEVWYAPNGTIARTLASLPPEVDTLACGGWDHIVRTETDGPFSPWRKPAIQQLAKVCFRAGPDRVIDMGNHDVAPRCPPEARRVGVLEYRHFQYRSLAQMARKLRNGREAYEASDVHPMHGTHWRTGGLWNDEEMAREWARLCQTPDLVMDPAPLRVPV